MEDFIKQMLRNMQVDSSADQGYMIDERYRTVFSVLDENESGEITLDELGKFLRELFKEQIKELQEVIEREKIVHAMIARDASSPGKRTA